MAIRRPISSTMATACLLALITSCSSPAATSPMAPRSTSDGRLPAPTGTAAGPIFDEVPTGAARRSGSIADADPVLIAPSIPEPVTDAATALHTARAWAIANSTSYLDPDAGSWTTRAKPFVTGAEALAEKHQRAGAGGSTWALIEAGRCVTSLQHLAAAVPSRDVPTGPARHLVSVTATIAVTCATGQVQLTQFAAQLTIVRIHSRWLVADVER